MNELLMSMAPHGRSLFRREHLSAANVCQHERDVAAKDRLKDFGTVVTECFYVGYVRCLPPAILIDCRDNRSSGPHADRCLIPVSVWA
jgi:hypothetical protein